jgi:hypothetical protein
MFAAIYKTLMPRRWFEPSWRNRGWGGNKWVEEEEERNLHLYSGTLSNPTRDRVFQRGKWARILPRIGDMKKRSCR